METATPSAPIDRANANSPLESKALHRVNGAMAGAFASILLYAVDRSQAAIRHGAPDPLNAIHTERIEYFWRIAMCAFVLSSVWLAWELLVPAHHAEKWLPRLTSATLVVTTFGSVAACIWP